MPLDWDRVHLVVFDVDGTLYRQRPLRLRMARDLLLHTLLKRDPNVIAVLSRYRRIRERLLLALPPSTMWNALFFETTIEDDHL